MSEDLMDVVRRLGGARGSSPEALGDAIYRIRNDGYYHIWGYATWGAFVDAELAPLVGRSSAARLLRAGRQRAKQAEAGVALAGYMARGLGRRGAPEA